MNPTQSRDPRSGKFAAVPGAVRKPRVAPVYDAYTKAQRAEYNRRYHRERADELRDKRRAREEKRRAQQRVYNAERFKDNVPVYLWLPREDWEALRARGGTITDLIRTYVVWGLENDAFEPQRNKSAASVQLCVDSTQQRG